MPADGPTVERPRDTPRPPLSQVALLFLRLGFTAFGGPAAHIAIMENDTKPEQPS